LHPVKSTTKKHGKAHKEEKASHDVFDQLDSSIDPARRKAWTKQEELAMTHRGKYLRIYQVDVKKGMRMLSNVAFWKLKLLQHQVLINAQLPLEPLLNHSQARKILHGSSVAWRLSRSSMSWASLGIIGLTACCHDQG
jgi:hypothetical protein